MQGLATGTTILSSDFRVTYPVMGHRETASHEKRQDYISLRFDYSLSKLPLIHFDISFSDTPTVAEVIQ